MTTVARTVPRGRDVLTRSSDALSPRTTGDGHGASSGGVSLAAIAAAAALALLTAFNGVAHAATGVRDLGTLGGTSSRAFAINDARQVVGEAATTADAATHAFTWSAGRMRDLGTLGGDYSTARGVNASGVAIGWSTTGRVATAQDPWPAFTSTVFWRGGAIREMPYPDDFPQCEFTSPSGSAMTGWALNDKGHATGEFSTCSGDSNAWYFDGTRVIALEPNGWGATGTAINNRDQVVGAYFQGWLYANGTLSYLDPFATGSFSSASDINDRGTIVGSADGHAFRLKRGVATDLGTLGGGGSSARAVNQRDWIVGWSSIADDVDTTHAFLVKGNGRMLDLNRLLDRRSGWVLEEATDINDRGDIVGTGRHNGQQRAFLLSLG